MYQRILSPPDHSFFLFGPRSTGKTTWLKDVLPEDDREIFDLLLKEDYLALLQNPTFFRQRAEVIDKKWILVDEIQKLPDLLNDIHSLIQKYPEKHNFALSGSSARKLKRLNSNLLAGRAITKQFYPLVAKEVGDDFELGQILQYGLLPKIMSDSRYAVEVLEAYTQTYLTQEISQETLIKDIAPFARFLKIAAITNGEVVNLSNVARDAAIGRTTVDRYYSILVDTLIGTFLRPWRSKIKIKEVSHPKFYLFDTGIVRALGGLLREPVEEAERGALLETYVLHELRAWSSYTNNGGELFYWRTTAGKEVDFIWSRGKTDIGIEVKSSTRWRSEWSKPLQELYDAKRIKKAFGVYRGRDRLQDGDVSIYPVKEFSLMLYDGNFECT